MKQLLKFILILGATTLLALSGKSQKIISKFTWSSAPATKADVGPDAISISSVAVVSAYGSGEFGLNAGTPSADINMVLPASVFNLKGMEFAIDFRREESVASLFTRGSNFDFGMNGGNLYVRFAVTNDTGGVTSINSGNVYAIPADGVLHRYKFSYDNVTHIAQVSVDNVVRYTISNNSWRDLSWNATDNLVVGRLMDGTARNVAILDNMIITQLNGGTTLPLKLLSFTAANETNAVKLNWKTNNEYNVESISVERSIDGKNFSSISKTNANNNGTQTNHYSSSDNQPLPGLSYYRLKTQDKDGSSVYSEVKSVQRDNIISASIYPNPTQDFINLKLSGNNTSYRISLYASNGALLKQLHTNATGIQQLRIELTGGAGMYVLNVENLQSKKVESLKFQKL